MDELERIVETKRPSSPAKIIEQILVDALGRGKEDTNLTFGDIARRVADERREGGWEARLEESFAEMEGFAAPPLNIDLSLYEGVLSKAIIDGKLPKIERLI